MCSDLAPSGARPETIAAFEEHLAGRKKRKFLQEDFSITEMLENIDSGKFGGTDACDETAVNNNLKKLQLDFASRMPENNKKGGLKATDQKRIEQFTAMQTHWESRCYIAQLFLKEFPKGSPQAQELKDMSAEQLDKFHVQWAQGHIDKLESKRVQTTSWGRVDKTKGKYRTFGRLVIDFGGWECKEAVQGALTASAKCSALGLPWCKKHPQSELLEFLVLETEFEETFSNSWAIFKEEMLAQPSIRNDSEGVQAEKAHPTPLRHLRGPGSGGRRGWV